MAGPVIHTYHEPVEEIAAWYDVDALLDRWRAAWAAAGWEPVVLDRDTAARHRWWTSYSTIVATFPTRNAPAYEAANFHRWLAMAVVGGGILTDADVLPSRPGWRPEPPVAGPVVVHSVDYLAGDRPCPCFVQGSAAGFDAMCRAFAEAGAAATVEGLDHVSDQDLLQTGRVSAEVRDDVLTFGDPRQATAAAVHFKTDSLVHLQGAKSERIAAALESA